MSDFGQIDDMAVLFGPVADDCIFRALIGAAPDGLTPGALSAMLDVPASTLSFHLKELSRAGLIASRQEGRFVWYRADLDAMNGLVGYLTENCCRGGAACAPECAPTSAPRAVAVAMPAPRRRKSA